MATSIDAKPIPEPPRLPLLKHLHWLAGDQPAQALHQLTLNHGPLLRLEVPGRRFLVAGNHALIDEACDTTRFAKQLPAPVERLRVLGGDGLFSAYNDEPNWALAHRILMPAFSQDAMRQYHDMMLDVGLQMVDRWARLRGDEVIDLPEHMTRLTLDVIALCGFDYRLNSFYRDDPHPFVDSMVRALEEAMRADNRLQIVNMLMIQKRARFERDVSMMQQLVERLIAERRAQPHDNDARDLLGLMLHARDPITGGRLSDENIRNQIVTFLIAGHETTSSLLSFTLHALMTHPEAAQRAFEEVDRVVGGPEVLPSYEHLAQLQYLEQALFESLRLWPPAPGFVVAPTAPTTLGGYPVTPDDPIILLLSALHRDPAVWGPDPERFDPARFDPEATAARPDNAWKPFGNGMRACIGRQFALQEAKLALALILQRFELRLADPQYQLDIAETLTFKPRNLQVRVRPRQGRSVSTMLVRAVQSPIDVAPEETSATQNPLHGGVMFVGYGSNMGTTRQIAQQTATDARRLGYQVEIAPLNDWVGRPLEDCDVFVIVTASYNGFPPDNAAGFCDWLDTLRGGALDGVAYTVFGCGHRDWASTYQAVPTRLDERLHALGATRICARGEGDARHDIMAHHATWSAQMWPCAHAAAGVAEQIEDVPVEPSSALEVELLDTAGAITEHAQPMTLTVNRELVEMSAPFARSKRHIALALPQGVTYRAGDHLVVTPVNARAQVERFARRLGWDLEQTVVLRGQGRVLAMLPVGRPLSLRALLTRHLELSKPVYPRHLQALVPHTPCPPERQKLAMWAQGAGPYQAQVEARALSLLDVLEETPSCRPPMALVLSLLAAMTPRTYSIASSPQAHPRHLHLTVSVLDAPARRGEGRFLGVCSNHLASLREGDRVWGEVRTPQPAFVMPEDVRRPVVLISAGTGFAPFRGFIQERAEAARRGAPVGPVWVFSGCDRRDVDLLYRDELAAWEAQGLIKVFAAASQSEGPVRFVQHQVWAQREALGALLLGDVSVYVCGDGRHMAPAVRETLKRVYAEATGAREGEVERWWSSCLSCDGGAHYLEDVWAG